MTVLKNLRAKRDEINKRMSAIIDKVTAERRNDLTEAESTRFYALRDERNEFDDRISEEIDRMERQADGDANRRATGSRGARVTNEPGVYRQDTREFGFLSDVFRSQEMGDFQARERLQRHAQGTQQRAAATGNLAGLVPPQYLVDLYAPIAREGRVTADAANRTYPLPERGQTVTIPRGVQGTTVGPQVAENTALPEQDISATDLVVPVRTIGGGTEVSRQALERGEPGLDQLVFADLAGEYALEINEQVIRGTGTLGTMKGLLNSGPTAFTYTAASPKGSEYWRKLAGAIAGVRRARKLAPNAVVMTPERWSWLSTELDENGRPLVVPAAQAPQNVLASSEDGLATLTGFVGTVHGLNVLVDAVLPTDLGDGANQDPTIIGRREDWHLMEEGDGTPRELRFEQPKGKQLTVQLFLYGYAAFTAERYPTATGVLSGTGTVSPSF
ncbi:phage major capsid protein [Pseudonocardia alni]|uniref:phage major capsid protein n=1 Tax=Pseudonocardia alni TaxID=33907 RepID=UPI0033E4DF9D